MKRIIFSDLHANLFGLNKILEFARSEQIERIYCLGDIVGYHSYPSQCIQLLREHAVPTIKGNHEALLLAEIGGFDRTSIRAQHSLRQTRGLLNAEEINYLKQLPFSFSMDKQIRLVHANYDNLMQTVNSAEKAEKVFEYAVRQNIHLTFLGHTHRPGVYMTDGKLTEIISLNLSRPLTLYEDKYYIVNPGSAGESRHNLPLSFILFDDIEKTIRLEVIRLSPGEGHTLKQHNKAVFGPLSAGQKFAQSNEKLRRFYYSLQKKL